MKQQEQTIFFLENLGCANCAAKMERAINKLEGIEEAVIHFMTKKLIVTYKKEVYTPESLLEVLQKTITKIEHDVVVTSTTSNTESQLHEHQESCDCGSHHYEHEDSCDCNHTHHTKEANQHAHNHTHRHQLESHSFLSWLLPILVGTLVCILGITLSNDPTITLLLVLLGYAIAGWKVLYDAFENIRRGSIFDENFLIIVATIGAFYIGEYPEAIAVMVLFQIGEHLQDLAVDRSRKHLASAMNLKAEYANIQTLSGLQQVAPESVQINDIIVVRPKEKIPIDGIVLEGTSFIDTSSLTGESVPRKVKEGDEILSGCLNGEQTLKIKVTKQYTESTVAKVLNLVENANSRKSQTEAFITKFAHIYTPIVVCLAVLVAILPPIVTKSYDFSTWIYNACGFLVVSCPCALVISVPLGFFAGIGSASKQGIIVKGGNYLEALNHVTTIVFDKTGTLTKGTFSLKEILPANSSIKKEELLYHAALLESFSTHPIATSIVTAYHTQSNQPLDVTMVSNYTETSGHGVSGTVNGTAYYLGNRRMLETLSLKLLPEEMNTIGTVVYLATETSLLGTLIVSDEVKEDSKATITALNERQIQTVLLTGDSKTVALKVADLLGLRHVFYQLLPTDKVTKLEELLSEEHRQEKNKHLVAFVGDGINDAPVIARADVGIAMGGVGSDAAIEAADIVLMTDEPMKIKTALMIAKKTKRIVTENIIGSLSIKAIILLLFTFGIGSMWLAVFADVGVSLLAILNSIRILKLS